MQLNRKTQPKTIHPSKVLLFGGGNFLRAFIAYFIDVYNEKANQNLGITVVKVTPKGDYQTLKEQDGLYHVYTKGIQAGQLINEYRLIRSVSEIIHAYQEWAAFLKTAEDPTIQFLFSNTTESGLVLSMEDRFEDQPAVSFPAKLTQWLYHRFQYFAGDNQAACYILPCELIENNGSVLQAMVMECANKWQLPQAFQTWIEAYMVFCNTLVDRIVPGIPEQDKASTWAQIGYQDQWITAGEPYHLFVIEKSKELAKDLPLHKVGLNVIFTEDLKQYREQKVRLLNGAHTALVPIGYLLGLRLVRDTIDDALTYQYLQQLFHKEIIPLIDLPQAQVATYAASIIDRFGNPFIDHQLLSIALNSCSKFKVRLLPSLVDYSQKYGAAPPLISFALASLIQMYQGTWQGEPVPLKDDPVIIEQLRHFWEESSSFEGLIHLILAMDFWDYDLASLPGLKENLVNFLKQIEDQGVRATLQSLLF